MTSPVSLFCDECGAANGMQAIVCFACNQPLNLSFLAPTIQAPITPVASMVFAPISTSTAEPLLPGTVLAQRYRIEEEIGQGGFGIVYKARDINWNRRVAIKQINLHALNAKEIIEATDSYNREVKLLSTLVHPNLPRIYDHFTDPEHWYLVMDFIEGETLEEYLEAAGTRQKKYFFGLLPARKSLPASAAQGTQQASRLPMREVLDIGIQLCKVLNYLHMRQPPVIFRDVKPANIMRNPRGHIYLIDFGIARQFTPGQARDTGPLGSPGYAAPEQYGKAQTTVQTDVYGLGATLQTLLTGKDPLELSLAGAPAGHKIPKKLQRLLDRMLERDSTQRPKTMREVHKRLELIKLGIKGLAARFSLGLLIGSMPGPILVLLLLLSSLHVVGLGHWIEGISLALYCTWPLAFLAQLTTGIVFLCFASKRIVGLGILMMLVLYILELFMRWIPLGMPGFGFGY
jgi:hypothetical protein